MEVTCHNRQTKPEKNICLAKNNSSATLFVLSLSFTKHLFYHTPQHTVVSGGVPFIFWFWAHLPQRSTLSQFLFLNKKQKKLQPLQVLVILTRSFAPNTNQLPTNQGKPFLPLLLLFLLLFLFVDGLWCTVVLCHLLLVVNFSPGVAVVVWTLLVYWSLATHWPNRSLTSQY